MLFHNGNILYSFSVWIQFSVIQWGRHKRSLSNSTHHVKWSKNAFFDHDLDFRSEVLTYIAFTCSENVLQINETDIMCLGYILMVNMFPIHIIYDYK